MKTKTKSLSDLIKACKFDYVNENIEKLFKTEPIRGKVEIKNFGKYMTSEAVIEELKKDGCVPANATELFHWIFENPEHLKGSYGGVVGLGSVAAFEGHRRVPLEWWCESGRDANLYWFDREWSGYDWFAFVRESSPQTLEPKTSSPVSLDLPEFLEINGVKYQKVK